MTIKLLDAATYYRGLPHQIEAWAYLQQNIDQATLDKFAELYRKVNKERTFDNDWISIQQLAADAGAKFPELVAAQWALESGFGKYLSGKNNYFGIKGKGTVKQTMEDYGNGLVTIMDEFKDFATPYDCIDYLVTRWYKDYKGYSGVNNATSREEAAYMLKQEGYATDPGYTEKLINLMNQYA